MSRSLLRRALALVTVLAVGGWLGASFTVNAASNLPADKVAIAGSDIDQVETGTELLSDKIRVDTVADLILSVSAECSILNRLLTGEAAGATTETSDNAYSFGSVKLWLELDGHRVPVAADDAAGADPKDPGGDGDDVGEVTFCNRSYSRTVTGSETENDGLDTEDDYIRTRTANAFNWLAFDAGRSPAEGGYDDGDDNILTVVLKADFDESAACGKQGSADPGQATGFPTGMAADCADAYVGSRTLIVQPVHTANGETADSTDEDPATEEDTGPLSILG